MVKAIILIMLLIQILTISISVNAPGKHFKSYIDHWKHKDDPLNIVRRMNQIVQVLIKMTDQRQNKNKLGRSKNVSLKMTIPFFKMYRRFY